MNTDVLATLAPMIGISCTRKQVGRLRSLSVGFGEIELRDTLKAGVPYRKWELGSYCCPWRIVRCGQILCGSQDSDSLDKLNLSINQINFGRFVSLKQLTAFDVSVVLDNDLAIEFLCTSSRDDECFHIFCPGDNHIEYSVTQGWKIGKSNEPSS